MFGSSEAPIYLYPTKELKPTFRRGIDGPDREAALGELKKYHSRELDPEGRFGSDFNTLVESHSYLNIWPILNFLQVDRNLNRQEIEQALGKLVGHADDAAFINRARQPVLRGVAYQDLSCTYRHVSAISEVDVVFGEGRDKRVLRMGAAGSSGGHEFLTLSPKKQTELLAEATFCALVALGFPIKNFDVGGLSSLVSDLSQTCIALRGQTYLKNLVPNCVEFSRLAEMSAKSLAHKLDPTFESPDKTFQACFMGKHHWEYLENFTRNGLPQPGQRGRLGCISGCAESQVISRMFSSPLVPAFLGYGGIYLTSITSDAQLSPEEETWMHAVQAPRGLRRYGFIAKRGEKQEIKSLVIEAKLDLNSPRAGEDYWVYSLGERLQELGWNSRKYTDVYVLESGENFFVHGETEGIRESIMIPGNEIKVVKADFEYLKVQTSEMPCIYCCQLMYTQGVRSLHIDELRTVGAKGDDGLVMEWLINRKNGMDVSIGNLVTQ